MGLVGLSVCSPCPQPGFPGIHHDQNIKVHSHRSLEDFDYPNAGLWLARGNTAETYNFINMA